MSKRYLAKLHRVSSHGDERHFARRTASRCGFSLIERERRVAALDLSRVWDAPLDVLPTRYVTNIDQDAAEAEIVREAGADAVFNGLGGDSLFYATFQSLGVIDYAFCHQLGAGFLAELMNSCELSRESVWLVAWEAMKYGVLRRHKGDFWDPLMSPHLLDDETVGALKETETLHHPWMDSTHGLPPGKHAHVMGLATSALFYNFAFHRERLAPSVHALPSQPVVEACMRIPVYVLLADGISRGLARRAFADLLPDEVRKRTVKGFGFSLYQQVLRANLPFVRDALLGGCLAAEGVLDPAKCDRYLVPEQSFTSINSLQIMSYLAAEGWARQWVKGARQLAAA
jgi:asparagine synthase (glutamine-hydrolysing)